MPHTCTAHPNMEHSLLRHYNFTAVRVAAESHVFIGKLAGNWPALPTLDWIEVYRVEADGYTETFLGYATPEQRARLLAPMVRAAECVIAAERVAAMPRPQRMARAVRWTGAY